MGRLSAKDVVRKALAAVTVGQMRNPRGAVQAHNDEVATR